MSDIVIDVSTRDTKKEKNVKLREGGMIPAVVYGASKDAVALKFSEMEYIHKIRGKVTSSTYIDLKIEGQDSVKTVYIKEIQKNPVKNVIEHVDFIEVNPDKKATMTVGIVLSGDAAGVKEEGGSLDFISRTIEIECLPKDSPKSITVDITDLHAGSSIHAKDIVLPEGVKLVSAEDATIASVVKAKGAKKATEEESSSEEE